MSAEQRIREMGLQLPVASTPAANYANAVQSGRLLFIAGKAPLPEGGARPTGKLGREYTVEDGYRFARSAAVDLLAVVRAELGSLDHVARVVEVQGFVNATDAFEDHARVLDGCSDLLVEVFGERGIHARSVLGANSLRGGLPIVIRAVIESVD